MTELIPAKKLSPWEDERKVLWLIKLWPNNSAKQIAEKLSEEFGVVITRNAVIGKLHRLGLTQENSGKRPPVARGPSALRKPRPARKPVLRIRNGSWGHQQIIETVSGELPIVIDDLPRKNLTLGQMSDDLCHYIAGEDHLYCGNRVVPGLPYCGGHCRVMYRPLEARRVPA